MPDRDSAGSLHAPFDQGVFLLHYNRGREAFQEARYAEARRELENAQKLRPDDADVLNLLGLVYFKTNAFPEAEVIYRRLSRENPKVFILHSNLGLILFKQGKLDDAEEYLLRSVELRPNYVKSHLYLGLLYRARRKYNLAIEHLKFAGADKLLREVEQEVKQIVTAPFAAQMKDKDRDVSTAKIPAVTTAKIPAVTTAKIPALTTAKIPAIKADIRTQPATPAPASDREKTLVPGRMRTPLPATAPIPAVTSASEIAAHTAARKLQEAVDDVLPVEQKPIQLDRKIESASKTFVLHENGFLEVNFARSVHVKRGTVSSYSGNLKFLAESGLLGTTAQTLVKAEGQGKIFVYEKGRKTFLLELNEEFIYVEGSNLLALEDTLTYRVEPIYDPAYQRKIDTVKIFGKGSLAISTSIEPLTLRVTREYPLSISSNALVAWTGNLIPTVMDDKSLQDVMITNEDPGGFKVRFEGDGVVVSEQ
jgi:uncharacterized protein (AIM24 family)